MSPIKCTMLLLLLATWPALPSEADFNGRWDITVTRDPRARAWWLEIEGAGTPNAHGKFVSAYSGDLNIIDELQIGKDELTFRFTKRGDATYRARLVKGKLEGTAPMEWTGVRAPVIRDKDDGSWREGKAVTLFDGKDLQGWHGLIPGRELGWTVKDGLLSSTGGANNLISDQQFWNFKLHLEYRVGKGSNSGVGLRCRYEIQILEDFGKPPGTHSNGALYSRIAPGVNASKPAGEWQTYEIRLVGRQVTVVLNGKTLIEKGEVEGLTAIATDPNEAEPGPFSLQGDHGPVDFRNIVVTPLVK